MKRAFVLRGPAMLVALGVAAALASLAACGGTGDAATAPSRGSPSPAPPGVTPDASTCSPAAAAGVEVASRDLLGAPPYALFGCSLVYVARSGALVERDLTSGAETSLAPLVEAPQRPTISSDLVAWEGTVAGKRTVRVRYRATAETISLAGTFATAGEPRASGTSVVFAGFAGDDDTSDADVLLFDGAARSVKPIFAGVGQQRFADISSAWIAASDFSEDPDGRFDRNATDLADIILFDRASGSVTKRARPGKQAFPMLSGVGGDDALAYMDWSAVHPEPKLEHYQINAGRIGKDPSLDQTIADVRFVNSEAARPAMRGGVIEWVANGDGNPTLFRARADGSTPAVRVEGLEGLRLFAPSPSGDSVSGLTIVATAPANDSSFVPKLRAIAR